MDQLADLCLSQIHMVVDLEFHLRIPMVFLRHIILLFPEFHNNTLLIDNQPVFDPVAVSADQELSVSHKIIHALAAYPAVIFVYKSHWHIVVVNGRDRLNSICYQLIYQVVIKLQALWVYFSNAVRENS